MSLSRLKRAIRNSDLITINSLLSQELFNPLEIINYAIENASGELLAYLVTRPAILGEFGTLEPRYQTMILNLIIQTDNIVAFRFVNERYRLDMSRTVDKLVNYSAIKILRYYLNLPGIRLEESLLDLAINNYEIFKILLEHSGVTDFQSYLTEAINQYIRYQLLKADIGSEFIRGKELLKIIKLLINKMKDKSLDLNPENFVQYPELFGVIIQHPDVLKRLTQSRDKKFLDFALKNIPLEIQESVLDSQPGTLKQLTVSKIISNNLSLQQAITSNPNLSPQRAIPVSSPRPQSVQQNLNIDWSRVNPGRTTTVNRYYTVPELEQLLREHNISFPRNSRKAELIELLNQFR